MGQQNSYLTVIVVHSTMYMYMYVYVSLHGSMCVALYTKHTSKVKLLQCAVLVVNVSLLVFVNFRNMFGVCVCVYVDIYIHGYSSLITVLRLHTYSLEYNFIVVFTSTIHTSYYTLFWVFKIHRQIHTNKGNVLVYNSLVISLHCTVG